MIKFGNDIIKVNGGWINYTQPVPPVPTAYTVNLVQTEGGQISAVPMSGYTGSLISLGNAPDTDYIFMNYNLEGATLNADQESFYIGNSNVSVTGVFDYQPAPAPEITEVWVYIDREDPSINYYKIQVSTLKLNDVGITPTEVKFLDYNSQTWIDDTVNANYFNDNNQAYESSGESIRFKLPSIPSDSDIISYGPYEPYWAAQVDCNVYLVGLDTNGNEYIIANSSYNQQTYYNNNKQRVELTYISPV